MLAICEVLVTDTLMNIALVQSYRRENKCQLMHLIITKPKGDTPPPHCKHTLTKTYTERQHVCKHYDDHQSQSHTHTLHTVSVCERVCVSCPPQGHGQQQRFMGTFENQIKLQSPHSPEGDPDGERNLSFAVLQGCGVLSCPPATHSPCHSVCISVTDVLFCRH